jgi:hypothetical protein
MFVVRRGVKVQLLFDIIDHPNPSKKGELRNYFLGAAIPLAMAWVSLIELFVGISALFVTGILLRTKYRRGRFVWSPCAPITKGNYS